MDTSYLTTQVSTIIGQLHGLFDEIGVPNHERETRESEVSQYLSQSFKYCADLIPVVRCPLRDAPQPGAPCVCREK